MLIEDFAATNVKVKGHKLRTYIHHCVVDDCVVSFYRIFALRADFPYIVVLPFGHNFLIQLVAGRTLVSLPLIRNSNKSADNYQYFT